MSTTTEQTEPGSGDPSAGDGIAGLVAPVARILGHLVGIATTSMLAALPTVNWQSVELLWTAWRDPNFQLSWQGLLLHVGLSAALWAIVCVGFHWWRSRRSDETRVIEAKRGSVMLETLIVIVPFLLLVSGLAQLALFNIADILADLAVYQGTRTAWVWEPELGTSRNPDNDWISQSDIRDRARLASAAVLAPTAPSNFRISGGNLPTAVRQMRGTMYATYGPQANLNAGNYYRSSASTASGGGDRAVGPNLNFARAFDDDPLRDRAARKLTFAYLSLVNYQVDLGSLGDNTDTVSVSFTYRYNVVFPWFAYIFGQERSSGPGGRGGWYVDIVRPRSDRGPNAEYRLQKNFEL